jgi:cobalt-zinc-cadmium efflux system outer membrane protein
LIAEKHLKKLIGLAGPLVVLLFASAALAQQSLTLQEAVHEALANNARVAIARDQVADAAGQRLQAALKPNPRLTVQTEDIRPSSNQAPFSFVNSTEDYLILGQVIESGGKRARRVSVADSALHRTEAQRALAERQLIGRVAFAYWSAVASQQALSLANQNLTTYEDDYRYGSNRVREGVMAESDLIKIGIERDRARAEVLAANSQLALARTSLYREMGRADFADTNLSTNLQDAQLIVPPTVEEALDKRPEARAARFAVEEAEANLRLQKALAKPDPEAFVGYKRNVGFDTAYAALQVDLPVRNRNQGNIGSAEARVRIAQSDLKLTETTIRADLEGALRVYRSQQELLNLLPDSLKRATEAENLARTAYREGGIDLLRLLDATRTRLQLQTYYLRALTDLQQAIINLQLASGLPVAGGSNP